MRHPVFIFGSIVLLLGTLVLWTYLRSLNVPETPRATVTILEGWTVAEINKHLRDKGVLVDGELPKELEGYLFPDTYEFFLDSSVEVVANRFRDNLESKLERLGVGMDSGRLADIIVVASLLEREVKNLREKRIASGILWKRLENGIALQVDATICYIKNVEPCLPITASDKKIDSPYNTYLYRGLPPGPIGNPGLEAILAALKPARSPYWYYISDPATGRTIFAETLDEHNQNIIKYLNE